MSTQSVNIAILAKDNASIHFKGAEKSVKRFSSALTTAIKYAGIYFGTRQIIRFAKDSINLFSIQEEAVNSLTDSLRLLNKEYEITELKKFASEIQKITVYGDEAVLQLMSLGVNMGKFTGDTLKSATIATIGLADALKIDTTAAMKLVAKASSGSTSELKSYGIIIDDNLTQQQKFNELLQIGNNYFEVSKGRVNTFAGQVKQLSNAWGDAKESIGEYIVSNEFIKKSISSLKGVLENSVNLLNLLWDGLGLKMYQFSENVKHTFTVVIPTYFKYLIDNWKSLANDLKEISKGIITETYESVKQTSSAISQNFGIVIDNIKESIKGNQSIFDALVNAENEIANKVGRSTAKSFMESFKSSLPELPKIADRVISESEKQWENSLKATIDNIKNASYDITNPLKSLDNSLTNPIRLNIVNENKNLQANENRFLSGITVQRNYQQEQTRESKKQTPILQRIANEIEKMNSRSVSDTVMVSNFS